MPYVSCHRLSNGKAAIPPNPNASNSTDDHGTLATPYLNPTRALSSVAKPMVRKAA